MQNTLPQKILLISALLFAFFLPYTVHYYNPAPYMDVNILSLRIHSEKINYHLPYHIDEWQHLAQSKFLIDKETIPFINPYFIDGGSHLNLESGFHIFLAELSLFTNFNLIDNFGLLPALLSFLNVFFFFLFIKLVTKKFYIALLSSLFFIALKNNVHFLGNWFFIPLTFSLIFIYSFFIILFLFLQNKNKYLLFPLLIIFIASFFVYPLASIFIIITSLIYFIITNFNTKKIKYKKFIQIHKNRMILGATLVILMIIVLYNITNLSNILKLLVFKKEWTIIGFNYNIIKLYGPLPLLLSIIGAVQVFLKYNRILLAWLFIGVINAITHYLFNFALLVPYLRSLFYLSTALVPLAAIGLYELIKTAQNSIKKTSLISKKQSYPIIAIIISLIVFSITFQGYHIPDNLQFSLYHVINKGDYNAIKFIDSNFDDNIIVLSSPFISTTIYPISGNYVIAQIDANLEGRNRYFYMNFMGSSCNDKIKIMNENNIGAILSKGSLGCEELKLLYSTENDFVYVKS